MIDRSIYFSNHNLRISIAYYLVIWYYVFHSFLGKSYASLFTGMFQSTWTENLQVQFHNRILLRAVSCLFWLSNQQKWLSKAAMCTTKWCKKVYHDCQQTDARPKYTGICRLLSRSNSNVDCFKFCNCFRKHVSFYRYFRRVFVFNIMNFYIISIITDSLSLLSLDGILR